MVSNSWWLRRLGWKPEPNDNTEAAEAAARAAQALRKVKERGPEVSRLSEEVKTRHDRNGFTQMLTEAMRLKE